jgi:predicted phosphodiesterase
LPYKDRLKKIEANRAYRKRKKLDVKNPVLIDIGNKFSEKELRAISKGAGIGLITPPKLNIDFSGDMVKIGFMTDSHMGSIYYKPEFMKAAFEQFDKENVNIILHAGDLSDGMSGRPGDVYELTHLGFSQQRDYCIEQLRPWNKPIYIISGNHDLYHWKNSGALIVDDVCKSLSNATYLGDHEGDIHINGLWIKLWHGADGASYAHSYRGQKIIESLSGGDKPHILLMGHDHKSMYFQERNVQAVAGGCMSLQSKWMRSKRLGAYTGFWIISVASNKNGLAFFSPTWYPFFC